MGRIDALSGATRSGGDNSCHSIQSPVVLAAIAHQATIPPMRAEGAGNRLRVP